MTIAINQAREAIELQLEPLTREAAELEDRLSTIRQSKTKLEAALKALAGSKSAKVRKSSKPCAKKETVMEVCLNIVKDNAPINKPDLESLAKDKLAGDLGYSLSGIQLRFGECLSSKAFTVTHEGLVSLAVGNLSKAKSDDEHQSIARSTPKNDATMT